MIIKTIFSKVPSGPKDIPKWIFYFHAGEQWLRTYELVCNSKNAKVNPNWLYYVEPHALYFSIELFVKALAAKENPFFNAQVDKDAKGRKIGHRTTAIIELYKAKIAIFDSVLTDERLFNLIGIYEDTLLTRFGETEVSINSDDTKLLFDLAESLWGEIESIRKKKRGSPHIT